MCLTFDRDAKSSSSPARDSVCGACLEVGRCRRDEGNWPVRGAVRILLSACALSALFVAEIGCSKPPPQDAPIATAKDLPDVVKSLREATMPLGRRVALNRLKAIGPAANTPEVLKELEEVRKKASPNEHPLIDETLARIKGPAEPEK